MQPQDNKLLYSAANVFLITFAFFFLTTTSHAQTTNTVVGPSLFPGSIQVTMSPSMPRPGQVVSFSVTSYSVDLQRSNILWYQDDTLVASGVGQTTFTSFTGDTGSAQSIRVIVQPSGEPPIERTLSVRPADVLLLWQAESYTPPFYKGKALHAAEGRVTVLAMPDIVEGGVRQPKNNLIFTWEKDGVVLGSKSGLGRDTLSFEGSVLSRPITISVEIETTSGNTKAKRSVQVLSSQPLVYLYEHHPTLGILFNSAVTNSKTLTQEETIVEAFPYFFSLQERAVQLLYEWRLGTTKVENTIGPHLIIRPGNREGTESLSVSVKNPASVFEVASTKTSITF